MVTRTRLIEPGDAERLADVLQRNRAFLEPWEPVRADSYFTVEGQTRTIAEALAVHARGQLLPHVILDEHGRVVGRISLNSIVRGAFQSASLGYWLDEASGGHGLATQAVAELVAIAFGELGLHRVEAGTMPHNTRSQAVLRRNGFVRFGYAPRYVSIAGSYRDHVLFQRLADD